MSTSVTFADVAGIAPANHSRVVARAAVELADAGWPVFPLNESRRPRRNCDLCVRAQCSAWNCVHPVQGHLPCHGWRAGTTHLPTVRAWFDGTVPWGCFGIAVPAHLFVLDIDPRNGGEIPMGLPDTLTVESGGGGWHLWFRYPGGNLAGALAPGADVKHRGGYVVAPPSWHREGRRTYQWRDPDVPIAEAPDWLLEALRKPDRPAEPPCGPNEDFPLTWRQILETHGWELVVGDGVRDRSGWRHPGASNRVSASLLGDRLRCWSTSGPLPADQDLSRLQVYAVLNGHPLTAGGMAAAAAEVAA